MPIVWLVQVGSSAAAELGAADAAASAPPAKYESTFENYRSFREVPIADWRALNDEVGRVGGHIGIFRGAGAHAGDGAGKPAASTPSVPASQTGAPAAAEGQPPVRGAPKAPAAAGHHH